MEISKEKRLKYAKAFTEVELLINDFAEELYVKIPKSFLKLIKDNKDNTYKVTLKELNTKGEMEETHEIMSLIFRDYLCDKEMSKKLRQTDKENLEAENNKYDDIFGNNKKEIKIEEESQVEETTALVEIKEETWYEKIFNKVKLLFSRLLNKK